MAYRGFARGRTIELEEPLPYPEGEPVSVIVEPLTQAHPPGSPAAILEVVRGLPHLRPGDVEAMERAIEEGKIPVRYEGVFDSEK